MSHDYNYSTLAYYGQESDANYPMYVYLYPDDSNDDDEAENQVKDALAEAGHMLVNNTAVDYYEISISYAHPGIYSGEVDGDHSDARAEWYNHLKNETNLPIGVHLLVDTILDHGAAEFGDASCSSDWNARDWPARTAWNDWTAAVTPGDGVTAIQETLHPLIDRCVPEVNSMIEGKTDHDLGKVYDNWWDDTASPMVAGYVGEHDEHGDCATQDANWGGNTTTTLTSCTRKAVSETAKYHL